jgi:type I restriction enzyme M protein
MTLTASTSAPRTFSNFSELANFLWSVADLLRGDYKQSDYGKVILPFTVLRRFDCVLAPTRDAVRACARKNEKTAEATRHKLLLRASGHGFYNTSKLDFASLLADPTHIAEHMTAYIHGFDPMVQQVLERFELEQHIARLDDANLLYQVAQRFAEVDLHPDHVPNHMMGSVFEELIRKFAEQSNETAGEHFTPREVIKLMVALLLHDDDRALTAPGIVKTLYDPACGTGGMLSGGEDYLRSHNAEAQPTLYGQELNPESWAICRADLLIKGHDSQNIILGNSFSQDGHSDKRFDYMLSNPPFGVEWKKVEKEIRKEAERGHGGRFGAGLPRINDGSLLFLQHMLSKMQAVEKGGSRIAIVFNGSPLFTGDAGSGESEIRRWILEQDWLEAIVALPDQLFYNTGISTYVWLLTNRKSPERRGRVQLVDGTELYRKMRKSLGDKRNELSDEHIAELVRLHGDRVESDRSKWFRNEDFGYRRIVVERPLRLRFTLDDRVDARLDESPAFAKLARSPKKGDRALEDIAEGQKLQAAIRSALASAGLRATTWDDRDAFVDALERAVKRAGAKLTGPARKAVIDALGERDPAAKVCKDDKGVIECDAELRDSESVALSESVAEYMAREVLPHAPDAWVDESKTRTGYEIPFTRHFYRYTPPRPLEEIEREIRELEREITALMGEALGR